MLPGRAAPIPVFDMHFAVSPTTNVDDQMERAIDLSPSTWRIFVGLFRQEILTKLGLPPDEVVDRVIDTLSHKIVPKIGSRGRFSPITSDSLDVYEEASGLFKFFTLSFQLDGKDVVLLFQRSMILKTHDEGEDFEDLLSLEPGFRRHEIVQSVLGKTNGYYMTYEMLQKLPVHRFKHLQSDYSESHNTAHTFEVTSEFRSLRGAALKIRQQVFFNHLKKFYLKPLGYVRQTLIRYRAVSEFIPANSIDWFNIQTSMSEGSADAEGFWKLMQPHYVQLIRRYQLVRIDPSTIAKVTNAPKAPLYIFSVLGDEGGRYLFYFHSSDSQASFGPVNSLAAGILGGRDSFTLELSSGRSLNLIIGSAGAVLQGDPFRSNTDEILRYSSSVREKIRSLLQRALRTEVQASIEREFQANLNSPGQVGLLIGHTMQSLEGLLNWIDDSIILTSAQKTLVDLKEAHGQASGNGQDFAANELAEEMLRFREVFEARRQAALDQIELLRMAEEKVGGRLRETVQSWLTELAQTLQKELSERDRSYYQDLYSGIEQDWSQQKPTLSQTLSMLSQKRILIQNIHLKAIEDQLTYLNQLMIQQHSRE